MKNLNSGNWGDFQKRYNKTVNAGQVLADIQTNTKIEFSKKEATIFDKMLTDISLYRKDGKFITSYHAALLKKRRDNRDCCPVFDISFQIMKQQEYNAEWKKKVYSSDSNKKRCIKMNLLDLNDAYEEFVECYLTDVFFNQDKTFEIDSQNFKIIKQLISYFTRQQDSELNIKKGICLYGGIGTGKSTIMRELSKFTKDKDLETQFDFIYMDDIYTDCDSSGLDSLNSYKFRSCCFDDIGMRAENNVNNYGTKINAYRELVRRQYTRYSRPIPSLSHYTTNIQYQNDDFFKDLAKTFGGRELDRFKEMCNFVPLLGNSRRK